MSQGASGNDNKLEFSTGVKNDTLQPHLEKLLALTSKIQSALHLDLSLTNQGATLAQLTSMKQTLQELHTLSHLQVTLGGDSRVKGGKGTGNAYVEMQAVLAELKALAASTRIQSALANEKNLRLQQQAFSTGSTKDFNKLDPEQRKYFKLGLEQAQKAGQLGNERVRLLHELNELDKKAVQDKKKQLNVFQKARQGQLSPQDLQDFIAKGSHDPKRLVRELGSIQRQSRAADLDPNLAALHSNRPSLLVSQAGIELSRLTQSIKTLERAAKEVENTEKARRNILVGAEKAVIAEAERTEKERRKILIAAEKAVRAEEERVRKVNDPNYKASERLKLEQANLRTGSVDSRSKGQALADERAQKKVTAELAKQEAIKNNLYHTEEKIKALRPEELKHARDTLNYQYAMSGNDKVKREQATQMLRLLADAETAYRKAFSSKPLDWTAETNRRIREQTNTQGELNPKARPALLSRADRTFDTRIATEEHTQALLKHRQSLTAANIATLTNAAELTKANQAVKAHSKAFPEQSIANQALLEAVKERTKQLNHQRKLNTDPNYKANELLKTQQANLRTGSVSSRLTGQALADERAQKKVTAELSKQEAIKNGLYHTEEKIKALRPEEIKHARDTLNYQYAMSGNDKVRREQATQMLRLLADAETAHRKAFSSKPLDWTAETNRRVREQTNAQGELNPKARPALLSRAERNFDTRIATEEHTQALLKHRQSLNAATIAGLTNAAELTRANQAIKLHSKTFPEQSVANQALLEAVKERTKQLNYQRKLQDPNFAASERLKLEQANLRTGSVDSRSKGQALADERAQKKVTAELSKQEAIKNNLYHTEEKIKALRPEEIKHARDTLNYQYAMSGNDKVKREQATQMLRLLADAETAHRKALSTSGLIVDLERTHYKTKESLRNLNREELQQAVQVLSYRTKIATTETQRAAAQRLLNSANQNLRLNPEAQTDNRAAHRDRILGDAGASLLTIQAGLMLNYKLLGGFQSLFSSAIDSAIKLDSAFRQLQAISAATNYEMATMKINLIDVAQASKFSASEVGETAVLLAQAGLSIQEISASMKGIITLAQATGTDLSKSVDVVTSVLSVFNKSAGETDQIVNQLTQALNSSKLDIQKMALGIQYAGNISADSGVSFEELTSALGAMANAGIRSGSTLGTGFRQMLLDLERPSTKLKARLDSLGLSFNEIDFRAYGLAGVLKNLREAGFTTADAFKTFEVRSAAAFSALSGNLDDFDRLQEELVDTNAAFEANHVQLEALAVQLDHLKSNLGIVMAEGLKPMTALTRDVAKGLAHMMENSEQGSSTLRVLGTTMAAITAGVAIAWLAKLTYEFGRMTVAAMAARSSLLFLTPAGLIGVAAGVALAVGATSAYSNELERMTTELDTAKGKFNEAKEVFASTEQNVSNIETAIKKLIDRYGVLSSSQSETTKEANSLKKQFEELGLQIEDTANIKVPQLLAALRTLRAEQTNVALKDLYNKSDKEQDKLQRERDAAVVRLNSREAAFTLTKAGALAGLSNAQIQAANPLNSQGVPITPYAAQNEGRDLSKGLPSAISSEVARMVSALETFKTTNTLPKDLNLAESMYNMKRTLQTSGLEPQKVAKVRAVLEELEKLLQAAESVVKYPERSAKAESAARRTEYSLKTSQLALDPTKALGQSQDIDAAYKVQLQKIDASKMSKTRKDYEAAKAASRAKFDVELNAAATQKEIDKIDPETTDENLRNVLNGLRDQLAAIKAISGSYDSVIQRMKEIGDKALEVKLKGELRALEEQLTELKKLWGDADSDPALESLRPKIAKKHQEVQDKRRQIANLKGEDLPSLAIEQGSETRQLGQVFSAQEEKVQDLQNKAVQNYKDFQRNKELENYEKAQTEWLETFRKGEESWSEIKKAEYKRLGLSANSSLSEGEMFGQVNKDLRARAQQIANATGVSQEYAQYGKGIGGFFAKQAAKRQQGALKLKEAQEKLARGLVTQDTLNPKIAEEQVAIKDLMEKKLSAQTQLENTMFMRTQGIVSDSDLAKQQELAEKDLSSIDKLLQSHQGFLNDFTKLRDDAKTDVEASLVYLQEGILKPEDELIKSLRAGQEALSSGLSSFMGDWASGMIQNTEDVKDAFEAMGKSILQSMLKVVTDRTATMFTNMLLGDPSGEGGLGLLGNLFGGGKAAALPLGGTDLGVTSLIPKTASHGGVIKGYAGGGFVSGTDIGHDIVPAMLRPDEYVLQPTATKALGTGFLDRLNSVTTGGLKQLEGKGTAPQINLQKSPPVNVYVVSPDQQRQMGSEDVVVAIQDNIMRNGSIKQLIKSVVVGEI